ncbi:hypothetical protein DFJ73DRAFT_892149 [Zopfochytrium polystomum]|nr:hypothetical protein DFJ73DRAFT_892149 [Zopfochytrium polystomum]
MEERKTSGQEMILASPIERVFSIHRLAKSCKDFAAVCHAFAKMNAVTPDPADKTLNDLQSRVAEAAVNHRNLMSATATAASKMIGLAEDIAVNMSLVGEDEYSVEDVKEALAEVADDAQEIVRAVDAVKDGLGALSDEVKVFRAVYEELSTCAQREENQPSEAVTSNAEKIITRRNAAIGISLAAMTLVAMSATFLGRLLYCSEKDAAAGILAIA